MSKATVWEQMDRLVLRGGMAVGRPSCAKDKPASSGMSLIFTVRTEILRLLTAYVEYLKRFFGLKHLIST